MNELLLKLYVSDRTQPKSVKAISNLRRICAQELRGQYELQIIDVLEHPEDAASAGITMTPAVVRVLPPPVARVIGDLSQTESVIDGLDLRNVMGSLLPADDDRDGD